MQYMVMHGTAYWVNVLHGFPECRKMRIFAKLKDMHMDDLWFLEDGATSHT